MNEVDRKVQLSDRSSGDGFCTVKRYRDHDRFVNEVKLCIWNE